MRAYVSEFNISVGPINVLGKLYPIKVSSSNRDTSFVSIYPDVDEPTKAKQVYVSPTGETYTQGDLKRAKEVDDRLVPVSDEEYKAAKESDLPLNVFKAVVHEADDFDKAGTVAEGSVYVFEPRNVDEFYGLLVNLVSDDSRVFLNAANVRKNEGLYRLSVWNGRLVLQRLVWPDEINEFDALDIPDVDDNVLDAASQMIDNLTVEFTPDNYQSTVKENLKALVANAIDGPTPTVEVVESQDNDNKELLAMLEAFNE